MRGWCGYLACSDNSCAECMRDASVREQDALDAQVSDAYHCVIETLTELGETIDHRAYRDAAALLGTDLIWLVDHGLRLSRSQGLVTSVGSVPAEAGAK